MKKVGSTQPNPPHGIKGWGTWQNAPRDGDGSGVSSWQPLHEEWWGSAQPPNCPRPAPGRSSHRTSFAAKRTSGDLQLDGDEAEKRRRRGASKTKGAAGARTRAP